MNFFRAVSYSYLFKQICVQLDQITFFNPERIDQVTQAILLGSNAQPSITSEFVGKSFFGASHKERAPIFHLYTLQTHMEACLGDIFIDEEANWCFELFGALRCY
jgi:hypothetical protein